MLGNILLSWHVYAAIYLVLADLGPIYYEPSNQHMEIIYDFVTTYVQFETEEASEVVPMMGNLGL